MTAVAPTKNKAGGWKALLQRPEKDYVHPYLGGMLLGMGLSAVFLFPAMTTQQHGLFDMMKSGHFDFANHFLFYAPSRDAVANDFQRGFGVRRRL